jgi:hypothetical protein
MAIEHAAVQVARKPWGAAISIHGAASTLPVTRLESCGFNARISMHPSHPGPAAQASVHQRVLVDSGSSGR